jgi:hypothetical protein
MAISSEKHSRFDGSRPLPSVRLARGRALERDVRLGSRPRPARSAAVSGSSARLRARSDCILFPRNANARGRGAPFDSCPTHTRPPTDAVATAQGLAETRTAGASGRLVCLLRARTAAVRTLSSRRTTSTGSGSAVGGAGGSTALVVGLLASRSCCSAPMCLQLRGRSGAESGAVTTPPKPGANTRGNQPLDATKAAAIVSRWQRNPRLTVRTIARLEHVSKSTVAEILAPHRGQKVSAKSSP